MDTTKGFQTFPSEVVTLFSRKNSTSSIDVPSKRDPISDHMLNIIHIVMTGVWYAICLTGMSSNLVNLRIFVKMGLVDSVTVSLFALAVSDFNLCSVALVELTSFFVDVLGRQYNLHFYIPPLIPTLYMMCIRRIFSTTTVIITTFLAVQRCLCVVLPFHVKTIFTRFRTCCFFVVVLNLDAMVHLWFLAQHPTFVETDPVTNVSQIGLIVPNSNAPIPFIIEIVIGIGMNIGCQLTVILCLVIMSATLHKAVKFKKTSSSALSFSSAKDKKSNTEGEKDQESKTSVKEYQALIQVSLISAIFVTCNIPLLVFGIVNIIIPEIDMYGEFHNLYHFVQNIMYTAELTNSSVNLIVYYYYNTKFRNCLLNKKK